MSDAAPIPPTPAPTGAERTPDEQMEAAVEAVFEDAGASGPLVGILMGSESDRETMAKAEAELEKGEVSYETNVLSAHRNPEEVADYARRAGARGIKVLICGAGLSAALPGVVAAHSTLPVIGVPLSSRTSVAGGLDALLSVTQMPPGVPVASVGVDSARNAAALAIRILALL